MPKYKKTISVIADLWYLLLIAVVAWVLIGYYWKFDNLLTGYQDWMYHAFRIKRIAEFGITSWDHIWANGINHWRSYQYLPHLLALGVMNFANITATKAMILWVIASFILIRITMYLSLRSLKVSNYFALLSTILSFTFAQQWLVIKDYSIFLSMTLVPVIIWIWVKSYSQSWLLLTLASVIGFCWNIHPLLGFSTSPLLLIGLVRLFRQNEFWKKFILSAILFGMTSLPFSLSYLGKPASSYMNPFFVSREFIAQTLPYDYLGLNASYLLMMGLSFLLILVKGDLIPTWSKTLFLYSAMLLGLIVLGKHGYLPHFIYVFQISRLVNFIALFLPMAFAGILHGAIQDLKSRSLITIIVILLSLLTLQAIEIGSRNSASLSDYYPSPFTSNELAIRPNSLVYYFDDSEASYFTHQPIRLAGSYNDHLLPSPLSLRLKNLMKNYTVFGIKDKRQAETFMAYTQVLGIEYYIVASHSPLEKFFNDSKDADGNPLFEQKQQIVVGSLSFLVFENLKPVANAYFIPQDLIKFMDMQRIDVDNGVLWDEAMISLSELLANKQVKTLPMEFVNTNELRVDTQDIDKLSSGMLLVTQNYDPNWKIQPSSLQLRSHPLNFMLIQSPQEQSNSITLVNNWPAWHWPLHIVNGLVTIIILLISVIYGFYKVIFGKKAHEFAQA